MPDLTTRICTGLMIDRGEGVGARVRKVITTVEENVRVKLRVRPVCFFSM